MRPSSKRDTRGRTLDRLRTWCDWAEVDLDFLVEAVSGGFASRVLTRIGRDHLVLPRPSPRNRLINDIDGIKKRVVKVLGRCDDNGEAKTCAS